MLLRCLNLSSDKKTPTLTGLGSLRLTDHLDHLAFAWHPASADDFFVDHNGWVLMTP